MTRPCSEGHPFDKIVMHKGRPTRRCSICERGRRAARTAREREARLTARGYSEKQISELLGRPARTVARDKAALRGQDAA